MASFDIRFIHLSDTAIISQDGRLSIINIFENINANQLPAIHPQLAVVGSMFYKGDKAQKPESCALEIKIESPSGKEIFSTSQRLPIANDDTGFVFAVQGLQVSEDGQHEVKVIVDDKKIGKTNLNVILNRT